MFGATNRKGKWRIRKETKAFALFGSIDLDLRDAVFEAPVVEISGAWCFGGLDIKVPAGIEVRDQTVGIFGGTDVSDLGDPQPGAPVLVVKGDRPLRWGLGERAQGRQEEAQGPLWH